MKIQILEEAKSDLIHGFDFYERQSPGLGSRFLSSLFEDIDSLLLHPGVHRSVFGVHRCIAIRFPFAIYYRMEGSTISVHAVIDCRRNPTWIRRRLSHPPKV